MSAAKHEIRKLRVLGTLLVAMALMAVVPAAASAEPRLVLSAMSNTTVAPGDADPATAELRYKLVLQNTGDSPAEGSVEALHLSGTLPPGITFVGIDASWSCPTTSVGDSSFDCESAGFVGSGVGQPVALGASVSSAASGVRTASFGLSGGTAPSAATRVRAVQISTAAPQFGIEAFESRLNGPDGAIYTQAGGHPDTYTTTLDINTHADPDLQYGDITPVEPLRDTFADLPPGLVAAPSAAGECTLVQLTNNGSDPRPLCPPDSQVGVATVRINGGFSTMIVVRVPVFRMSAPPGVPARFAYDVYGTVVSVDGRLRSDGDYGLTAAIEKISEGLVVTGGDVELWGTPADPVHDTERNCPGEPTPFFGGPHCKSTAARVPFLRMPTNCTPGLDWSATADSWFNPGAVGTNERPLAGDPRWSHASSSLHEAPGYPFNPEDPSTPWGAGKGVTGCDKVPVKGTLTSIPTTLNTESSSGLAVHVEVPNPGFENQTGISSSDIENAKLTLPRGLTINPSQAEGLGVCAPAQYESSRLEFNPDGAHGCPADSKIGTVEVKTPLIEETVPGNVYVAKPYDNPFDSLLALYVVFEEPQRGILVKLPGELRTNEETGQIEAEFDNVPQVPFDSFDFKFREGARAPLITPPTCGTYENEAVFTPWSDPSKKLVSKSSFQITHGIGGGPCPQNNTPGFKPLFSAGSINNNAGAFSPFNMRIQRNDGEQDMTRFSAVLPPGVLGKLAGVSKCPDSAIAIAKAKTGPHGGQEEIDHPSCPANSEIGHSIVGAGVGSVLTYVPGKVYLGGPFNGNPLSIIAITPVVAGPFDVGTVVVHEALTLNPRTAEVEVDGSASDPIPHILKGIPAKLRDLRVYVDRPEFTLNPTSCDPSATTATLFGGGGNAFSTLDDVPVSLSDRFQAASCASLGFKPKLALKLKGGTKRGGHPGLTATYTPKAGNANIKGLTVRLPRSAFLDQAHIRTICTRVQFAADNCPKAAQYGYIKAWTPLLETPLEGPVWLRSSNHKLPDLVFDLHGLVDVEVATRIDSEKGGIRASLESAPDAPLSKVVLKMQGAKKGLIINSRNLCGARSKANVDFVGHNGKEAGARPVMQAECGGKGRKKKR
jgi:hypothetical protein